MSSKSTSTTKKSGLEDRAFTVDLKNGVTYRLSNEVQPNQLVTHTRGGNRVAYLWVDWTRRCIVCESLKAGATVKLIPLESVAHFDFDLPEYGEKATGAAA